MCDDPLQFVKCDVGGGQTEMAARSADPVSINVGSACCVVEQHFSYCELPDAIGL